MPEYDVHQNSISGNIKPVLRARALYHVLYLPLLWFDTLCSSLCHRSWICFWTHFGHGTNDGAQEDRSQRWQEYSMRNRKVDAPVQDSPEQEPPIPAAGGVVYRWSAGQLEILLIKKQDGFWTLPKGRIKSGEDERTAVAREVAEETSVAGEVGAMVRQVEYTIQKAGRRRRKTVSYYLVRAVSGRPTPQALEQILHVRWFAVGVALRRIRRRRIRNVVRAAQAMLNTGTAPESGEA